MNRWLAVCVHLALMVVAGMGAVRNMGRLYGGLERIGGADERGPLLEGKQRNDDDAGWLPGRAVEHSYSTCANDTSVFRVDNIRLDPERIARGSTATFRIQAALEAGKEVDNLESGRVLMLVQYGGVQVFREEDGICDIVESCPLPRDGREFQLQYVKDFPYITPPGKYQVELRGESDSATLFCVQVGFRVAFW